MRIWGSQRSHLSIAQLRPIVPQSFASGSPSSFLIYSSFVANWRAVPVVWDLRYRRGQSSPTTEFYIIIQNIERNVDQLSTSLFSAGDWYSATKTEIHRRYFWRTKCTLRVSAKPAERRSRMTWQNDANAVVDSTLILILLANTHEIIQILIISSVILSPPSWFRSL
jgi:hypothetical protein